jgi:hypothetical protein
LKPWNKKVGKLDEGVFYEAFNTNKIRDRDLHNLKEIFTFDIPYIRVGALTIDESMFKLMSL